MAFYGPKAYLETYYPSVHLTIDSSYDFLLILNLMTPVGIANSGITDCIMARVLTDRVFLDILLIKPRHDDLTIKQGYWFVKASKTTGYRSTAFSQHNTLMDKLNHVNSITEKVKTMIPVLNSENMQSG